MIEVARKMLEESVANLTDLNFISGCIQYGARKGHYFFDADNPEAVRWMNLEMRSVVSRQELLDERNAQATVYSIAGRRVAVAIICESSPGDSSYELYALSVAKKYQDKGYGAQILDSLLDRLFHFDVCARCLPASIKMVELLEKRGFVFHSMDDVFKVLVKNTLDVSDIAVPLYMRY
jgi:GNAT superfamily N-acetyltransferase